MERDAVLIIGAVADGFCRAHDADTLFIIDGSVFVTGAALNPTSTIQAIALRAADHLIRHRLEPAR